MKKLLIAVVALSVSGGVYAEQSCKLSNAVVRQVPHGKIISRIKAPKSVILVKRYKDNNGQQWANVVYGEYDREAGFEMQADGWVPSKQLRNCR
ncbi:hypothetical protein L4G92_02525 [Neisseria sp. ZJ106]|uniref:SH3 domain-containing protein n=1 Tax=Neisseria lisongii TaxID=2912188 RepID=A0ABY7RI10_9NEIS|nr:hypothetical protein [Neisseria lisongii]MCF7520929.1 hypothetical protein [Neisseria lisongii]WCL71267.1 hypothetical protein PJU73_07990 [Neisseria lisongii]